MRLDETEFNGNSFRPGQHDKEPDIPTTLADTITGTQLKRTLSFSVFNVQDLDALKAQAGRKGPIHVAALARQATLEDFSSGKIRKYHPQAGRPFQMGMHRNT